MKKQNIKRVSQDVASKIETLIQSSYQKIAEDIVNVFRNKHLEIMKTFYDDYSPTMYYRKYRINQAFSSTVTPLHSSGYLVNVKIASENIHGKPYRTLFGYRKNGFDLAPKSPIDTEFVFRNVYFLGNHGQMIKLQKKDGWRASPNVKSLYPPPARRMQLYFNGFTGSTDYKNIQGKVKQYVKNALK